MVQGILLLLLPLRQLVMLYMHYLTVAVLAAADQFSRYYVSSESTRVEEWPRYEAVAFQVKNELFNICFNRYYFLFTLASMVNVC